MQFLKRKIQGVPVEGKRVIVTVGGGGVLGRDLIDALPPEVVIINVGRTNFIEHSSVMNVPFDLRGDLPTLVGEIAGLTPHVDVVINLAYTKTFSSIQDFTPERFLDEVHIDVAVPVMLCKCFYNEFWKKVPKEENILRHRKVINISSMASFGKTARPELATYTAAKSALNGISEYLHEFLWESAGVSAHVVAPAGIGVGEEARRAETVSALSRLQDEACTQFSMLQIP